MQNLGYSASPCQRNRTSSDLRSLELLIADLRGLRDEMIKRDRRERWAILAGQLALLAREYQRGCRPSRKTLRRFFHFVAGENML